MLTTEIFVKLCSIMVMDALISGMWTSVASGSGQSHAKLGMNKKESRPLEFGDCLCGMAIVTVTCFMDRTFCRTTRTWMQVIIIRRLIFHRSYLTARIIPP